MRVIAAAALCVLVVRVDGASAAGWQLVSLPRLPTYTYLYGIAARSPADVTAVGQTLGLFRPRARPGATVIIHWNGHGWARQAAPSPGVASRDDTLLGVSVVSGYDAWAVGNYEPVGSHQSAMILHWNGRRWSLALRLPSEAICHGTSFSGVYAASASDVWAAGDHFSSSCRGATTFSALLYHYNGRGWTRVRVPAPPNSTLNAISGTSGRDLWAVGDYGSSTQRRSLILHFNGERWAQFDSPHGSHTGRGTSNTFGGVAALSPSSAFAVGASGLAPFGASEDLVAHWDGTSWQPQATPQNTVAGANAATGLAGVAATAPSDAWAVGDSFRWIFSRRNPFGHTPYKPLALHWDGTSWQAQQTPDLGGGDHSLTAVTATSASDVWAVGNGSRPFILHCC